MRPNVAWRGSSGTARPRSDPAIAAAAGPARRTTPMPPRPGGVATATMVSVVENKGPAPARRAAPLRSSRFRRDDDGLQKRVADALGRDFGILGDGQVHDAPRVRI